MIQSRPPVPSCRPVVAVGLPVTLALALMAEAGASATTCGLLDLAPGDDAIEPAMVATLSALVSSSVFTSGSCQRLEPLSAPDPAPPCAGDDSCLADLASASGVDVIIAGTAMSPEPDAVRLRLTLFDATAGMSTAMVQRRLPMDPAVLGRELSGLLEELFTSMPEEAGRSASVSYGTPETPEESRPVVHVLPPPEPSDAPPPPEPAHAPSDAPPPPEPAHAPSDAPPPPEPAGATAGTPPRIEPSGADADSSTRAPLDPLDGMDGPPVSTPSSASWLDGDEPQTRVAIRAFGGFCRWQQGFAQLGVSLGFHVHRNVVVAAEISPFIGSRDKPGSSGDRWTYALIPFGATVQIAGHRGRLRPHIGAGPHLVVFFVDPQSHRAHVAGGVLLQGGADLLLWRNVGLFADASVGFLYAARIHELVDPTYWPGAIEIGGRLGALLRF